MNRPAFLALASALAILGVSQDRRPAFADGNVSITNKTIDQPVTVQGKLGNTLADAVPTGSQTIKKGETAVFDASNLLFFWRREVNPGTGDGMWTAWATVDARDGDQRVSF